MLTGKINTDCSALPGRPSNIENGGGGGLERGYSAGSTMHYFDFHLQNKWPPQIKLSKSGSGGFSDLLPVVR